MRRSREPDAVFRIGRRDVAALAVLWAVVFGLLAPVVFGGAVLLPVDLRDRWEPWRSELRPDPTTPHNDLMGDALWEAYPMAVQAQRLWRHGLPLWDPTALIGMPGWATGKMYSNPVYGALAVMTDPAHAMSWAAVVHLLIALTGTYLLLRELGAGVTGAMVGATAFALNGYLLVWLSLTYFVGTMVWTPLVFWGIERALQRRDARWLAAAALAFAGQILAGFVLFAAHSGLLVTAFYGGRAILAAARTRSLLAGWRPALFGALAIVGGVGLAAIQFLPTLALFQHTARVDRQLGNVLPVHEMVRLLVPDVAGTPLGGQTYQGAINYAETTLYLGLVPLLCLVAGLVGTTGRRRRQAWLLFSFGFCGWMAVYGISPFFDVVQRLVPGIGATFTGRVFFLVAFAWSVAAGLGADALVRRDDRVRPPASWSPVQWGLAPWGRATALMAAAALLVVVRVITPWWTEMGHPLERPEALTTATALLVAGGVAIACTMLRRAPLRLAAAALLIALTVGDLVARHGSWNTMSDAAEVLPTTPNVTRLLAVGRNAADRDDEANPADHQRPTLRLAALHGAHMLPGMAAQAFGLSNVSGYSSWILERYSRYATLTGQRMEDGAANLVTMTGCCGPLHDALAIDWVYAASNVHRLDHGGLLIDQLTDASVRSRSANAIVSRRTRLDGRPRRGILLPAPGRLSFPLDTPTPERLTTGIGLNWRHCSSSDGVRFKVRVHTTDGRWLTRFDRYVVPQLDHEPTWLDIDIPLADDGETIDRLLLVTLPGPANHAMCDQAWWGEPRLHHPSIATTNLKRIVRFRNPIYRNQTALPRVRLVHRATAVAPDDLDAAAAFLVEPTNDRHDRAVVEVAGVEGLGDRTLGPAQPGDHATLVRHEGDRWTIETRSGHPALLVVAEQYLPGWRARIDGEPAPVVATNLTLRGVMVPAGEHQVTLIYRPTSFLVGRAISVTTTLVMIVGLLMSTRVVRRRRATRQGQVSNAWVSTIG